MAAVRQRLAELVPAGSFGRLLQQLFPASSPQLAQLARGWLRLQALGLVQAGKGAAGVWAEVLAVAVAGGTAASQLAALTRRLLQAEQPRQRPAQTAQQLLQAIARRRLAVRGLLPALLAAQLPATRPAASERAAVTPAGAVPSATQLLAPAAPRPPAGPTSLRPKPQPAEAGPTDTAYVANAGLVLLWPFFTMLFDRLGYLELRQFKTPELAERATHLLQFLVTGEESFPEYQLVLNRLLCGVAPGRPLARTLPLTAEEKATGEDLLRAVLARWEVLKNTSIGGLRETFLQRGGRLDYHAERVALTVETKTLDILLDQRPWSISTIKLPWMALPLYVTWR